MRLKVIFFFCVLTSSFFAKAQNSVKTHEGVEIGGIKQWIGAKGTDDTKPLLLFLHGGPGFSSRSYSKKWVKALKNDFIVAQWDQRDTGITKAWNISKDTITLERLHQDTEEVVKYVLNKFKKEKLYLVGYSWGGFLGFEFASKYPELLHAYIPLSAMIYHNKSEQLTKEFLLDQAQKSNNTEAIEQLSKLELPISTWQDMYTLRKWTSFFVDGTMKDRYNSVSLYKPWAETWFPIFRAAAQVNYPVEVPEINCPVYFFTSKSDYVAHFKLAKEYYGTLKAPHKELIWFPEAGHDIPSKQPKAFADALIQIRNKQ